MDEDTDLRALVVPVLRRWRLVLGAAVVAMSTALVLSFAMPPRFEATAGVVVAGPPVQLSFDPRIDTLPPERSRPAGVLGALASSPELARQVLEKNLDAFQDDPPTPEDLLEKVKVARDEDPNLIQVTVEDQNAERAARLANSWVETYVQYVNEIYRPQSDTETSVEAQVAEAERELEAAEDALIEFQKENRIAVLEQILQTKLDALRLIVGVSDSARANVISAHLLADQQELSDLLATRSQIRQVTQRARSLADRIREQGNSASAQSSLAVLLVELESMGSTGGVGTRTGLVQLQVPLDRAQLAEYGPTELLGTLASLTDSLAEQEQVLTARIAEVSDRLVQSGSATSITVPTPDPTSTGQPPPPVVEEIQRLTREIADLQGEIADAQRTRERLTLNRDTARNAYTLLSSKLAEVRVNSQLAADEVRTAWLATVPLEPVWPRPAQNAAIGLFCGLVIGVLAALAQEHLLRTVWSARRPESDVPEMALTAAGENEHR